MAVTLYWQTDHKPIHVSLGAGTLTLSFDGKINLSFDGEGRLNGAFLEQITYRRALDNRVLAKWTDPERPRRRLRRFLTPDERKDLLERCYGLAGHVAEGLGRGQLFCSAGNHGPFLEALVDWLARVVAWDWARLEAEQNRFLAVYKPVPILPPDQYLSVVVQATEGCSYNRCTFCTFYRDRPFRIKSVPTLQAHLCAIQDFLGRGVQMRKGIFLADANAVIVAQRTLVPMLQAINEHVLVASPHPQTGPLPGHPRQLAGIYAFVSAPDALHKTSADFADLRTHDLRRVYVGLETGHDPLRRFLCKPGTAADVVHAVQTIKAGGVAVGLIVMVGVGGQPYRDAHLSDTVGLLRRMPLDEQDIVYLSPFVASADSPYVADIEAAGLKPMDEDEIEEEMARFRRLLKPWAQPRGIRVSTYDVREFVY